MVLAPRSSIRLNVTANFASEDPSGGATWGDKRGTFQLKGPRRYLGASVEPVDDLGLSGQRSMRPPQGEDDTSLVILDVPPGRYHLHLFPSRGYAASANAKGVDVLQEPLVILPGADATVDVNMRDDFAEIDGTFTNPSSELKTMTSSYRVSWQPQAYVYLVPVPGEHGNFQQVGAGPEGHFTVGNVAPGKYLVLAFEKPQNNLPYRDAEAMRSYEPKGKTVSLAAGQKEKLELAIISNAE